MSIPYQLGISSMGCPEATFEEALSLAEKFGIQYLELRSLGGTIDMPEYLANTEIPDSTRPKIQLLATSFSLLKANEAAFEDLERYGKLAARLKVPYLRVFGIGGSELGDPITEEEYKLIAQNLETARSRMRENNWDVEILLEAHDRFSSSDRCLALNEYLPEPVKLLWDSFHTWNQGMEAPQDSLEKLGSLVTLIHYNDCVSPQGSVKREYVPTGHGIYPSADLREALKATGYSGGITLEWEKLWHPELAPLDQVLGDFVDFFGN